MITGAATLATPPEPFDPLFELQWGSSETAGRILAEQLDPATESLSRPRKVASHVKWLSHHIPGRASVLDAGCGPGLYCSLLAAAGYQVTGVDINPAAIRYAKEQQAASLPSPSGTAPTAAPSSAQISYSVEDLFAMQRPEGEWFDAVLLLHSTIELFPLPLQKRLLAQLSQLVSPGGTVVVECRTRPDYPPGRVCWWEWEECSLLSSAPHLLLTEVWGRKGCEIVRQATPVSGGIELLQSTTRPVPLPALERWAAGVGLEPHAIFDGWSNRMASDDTARIVALFRKRDPHKTTGTARPAGN